MSSSDREVEEGHGVGIVPVQTGMSDGGVAEEDALSDICKKAVPSLNVTEPDTAIPDMIEISITGSYVGAR